VLLAEVALSKTAARGTRIMCTLAAGAKVDRATVRLAPGPAAATGHLMLSADFGAPTQALARCRHYAPRTTRIYVANVQISAIKVGTLTLQ
jgi:hypothetical protein